MENQKIYIDCNRENAEQKSDTLTNEWTTQLLDGVKLPKGTAIKIQNSFINYQGLEGGSLEILEDEELTIRFTYYISHSDFFVPNPVPYPSDGNPADQNIELSNFHNVYKDINNNNFNNNVLFNDAFKSHNYNKLFSEAFQSKLNNAWDNTFSNGAYFGHSEQPLFAVFVDSEGFLKPIIDEVVIRIPKGIYGISELSNLVQDQLTGKRINYNIGRDLRGKTQQQETYEEGRFQGNLTSPFYRLFQATGKNYDFTVPGGVINKWIDGVVGYDFKQLLTINLEANEQYKKWNDITEGLSTPFFITAEKFNELWDAYKNSAHPTPNPGTADFFMENFKNENYIGYVENIQYKFFRDYTVVQPATDTKNSAYEFKWDDYNPLYEGYYLGTTDFNLDYSTDLNGFSISFLHQSRRIPTHDIIGNPQVSSGSIVSYIRKFSDTTIAYLDSILGPKDFGFPPWAYINVDEERGIKNSLSNPRSRCGGVMVLNWDTSLCVGQTDKGSGITKDWREGYYLWNDYFTSKEKAEAVFKQSFWSRLGFSYEQLVELDNMEVVKSFDRANIKLIGTTTNNTLDSTALTSISSLYNPAQAKIDSTTHNPIPINLNIKLDQQVQSFNYLPVNRPVYAIGNFTYQVWNAVFYVLNCNYPVLTTSQNIVATKLPQLSQQGYFLITSDIIDGYNDIVKKNQPLSLLGVVPKSSLSNQDFISSFNDITHILPQDKVINKIKIRILNPDLTNPQLGTKSSIILEITKPPQTLFQTIQEEEEEKKKK